MSDDLINKKTFGVDQHNVDKSLFTIEEYSLAVNTCLKSQQSEHGRIIYVRVGVIAIITEKGRYLVPPGQAIWLPATVYYQLVAATASNIVSYSLHEKTQYSFNVTTTVLAIDDFLKKIFNETIRPNVMAFSVSAFHHLCHLLLNRLAYANPLSLFLPALADERLLAITRKQQKFPALKTDLIAWGKFVNASPRTLSRLFKKETGMTYSQWKQVMLIHIAIIQLSLGESIIVIAKNLGYESSSAFIYMFKKHMKVTPSHYLSD